MRTSRDLPLSFILLLAGCGGSGALALDGALHDGQAAAVDSQASVVDGQAAADAAPDAPGTDAAACSGDNPALACRRSPGDCLPSACACSDHGWACTADCGGGRACADAGADGGTAEQRCLATGGTPRMAGCCLSSGDFPDSCAVGACGCSPASSHPVTICGCPAGACFSPGRGCLSFTCTPGADQTCNDDPVISSLRGRCQADLTCACNPGATLNPATGKCR
jgi:hypothetical protein